MDQYPAAMRPELTVDLAAQPDQQPVFLSIARSLADDIARGRLRPGQALPGSRTLAASLGVHRNTVLAAYRELEAEGWTVATPARATRVRDELPTPPARRRPAAGDRLAHAGFDLGPALPDVRTPTAPAGAIKLYGGLPDLSLVPARALARAYRRALASRISPLGYGDPAGEVSLRTAFAELVARQRGVAATPDDVVVTRGSQLGLYLTARVLLAPGDVVAVEAWGYRPAWEALRATGAELVPVRVDADGLDVDALGELAGRRRLRAVYVTPHHQYPTTALMSQERRMRLLALARHRRFAVIEDDYDHEFHYDKRPVLPLASQDTAGVVVYVGTLSKILAPGLRLGFVIAPRPLTQRLTAYRTLVDRQGNGAEERAIAELIEDGEVERHARRMRRVYAGRRDVMLEELARHLGGVLELTVPAGGMAIWAHAPGVDVEAWSERAARAGVLVQTAQRFAFDGRRRPFLRLGFACEAAPRLRAAIERLKRTLTA